MLRFRQVLKPDLMSQSYWFLMWKEADTSGKDKRQLPYKDGWDYTKNNNKTSFKLELVYENDDRVLE